MTTGSAGFDIRAVYTVMGGDFKEVKEKIKKKTLKNSRQAAIWLWRAVKNRIRRSSSKKQVIQKEQKIWSLGKTGQARGVEIRKSPTEWMSGKKSVAPNSGRGGRKRVIVQDTQPYRWNKVSKPGEGPMTHPANQPGWQDEWLRNSILFNESNGHILIYSNPAPPGKRQSKSPFGMPSRLYPRMLEFGGSYNWSRKIQVGYVVVTIRQGTRVQEGTGRTIAGKKQNDGKKMLRMDLKGKGGKPGRLVNANSLKNKSGRTQKSHKRRFREPHVALRREYDWIGGTANISARPFMRPVQARFFQDYFPQLYQKMLND